MTYYLKIRDVIIRSIEVNVMNFQSSFWIGTYSTLPGKGCEGFFSIFSFCFSVVHAFFRAIVGSFFFPVFNGKRCVASGARLLDKFFRLRQEVTLAAAKFFSIYCHDKFFIALATVRKIKRELSARRTFFRTKFSFVSVCNKFIQTVFANFFHSTLTIRGYNVTQMHI